MKFGIFASDLNGGIGKDGKLPWHFSEDMAFFKATTEGSICVMGRKTHDEIYAMRKDKKVLLPKRECLVLTSQSIEHHATDTYLIRNKESLETFLKNVDKPVFYTGGKSVFEDAMKDSTVDGFYVTTILGTYDCDVHLDLTALKANFELSEVILANHDHIRIEKWMRK